VLADTHVSELELCASCVWINYVSRKFDVRNRLNIAGYSVGGHPYINQPK
jgi:hypothetical protein